MLFGILTLHSLNKKKPDTFYSVSLLFKITGPSYNILNRFTKDVQRLDLLNNYYTLTPINDLNNALTLPFSIKYNLSNIDNIKILDNKNAEHIFKSISNVKSKFIMISQVFLYIIKNF